MDIDEILRDTRAGRAAANAAFVQLNNAGEGFDPSDEIGGWDLVRSPENTSDVAVYRDGQDVVLVATDGTGSDDSRWAVRVKSTLRIDIQEGDAVAYVTGPREGHDYGRVLAVTADRVTVHWLGSETRHTHTAAQAAGWDVYTHIEDAHAAFKELCDTDEE